MKERKKERKITSLFVDSLFIYGSDRHQASYRFNCPE